MSTAILIFEKDVRRHAFWLLAWLVACVSPFAVEALPPDAMVGRFVLTTTGYALRIVVFLLLVQLVVHEDPLVDTTAFWLTRPIGGRALFAGKVLFVGALLVLPAVVADTTLLATAGADRSQVLLAVPEIVLEWTLWASMMLALAALSSTTRGMVAAGVRVALVWLAMELLVRFAVPFLRYPEMLRYGRSSLVAAALGLGEDRSIDAATFTASRTIGVTMLEIAGALATATVLFLTRRTRLAWATVVAALLGVVAASTQWRWDFFRLASASRAEPASRSSEPVAQITAMLENAAFSVAAVARTTTSSQRSDGENAEERTLYGRAVVTGLEPPLAATISRLAGSLTFADGTQFVARGGGSRGVTSTWDPLAVELLLGGARFANLEQENAFAAPIVTAPVAEYRRHQGESGRLEVTATLAVSRYRLAAELPPQPGMVYEDGSVHEVVAGIGRRDGNCVVQFRERQIALLFAPTVSTHTRVLFFRFNPKVLYVLRNRRRGEAFWPQSGAIVGFGWPWRTRIDDATLMTVFRGSPASGPRVPAIDDAWFANADLVRIEAESVGTIERRAVTPNFTVPVDEGAQASETGPRA